MRSHTRLLLILGLTASIAILGAPAALAQCSAPQVFGSTGLAMLGMVQVEIAGGVSGTEIGRFWNAANSAFGNNFANTCPAAGWVVERNSGDRGISGGISAGDCTASTCPNPDDEMIWLLEDYGPTGPPGIGDTAHFIGFRMDATPPAARYWDLARAAGNVPATLEFNPFPEVVVTSILGFTPDIQITFDLADAGENFWGENAGGPIPDSASIVSYDICVLIGENATDPGRSRSSWDCPVSIPYTGGPSVGNVLGLACPSPDVNNILTVGITFSGGPGGNVESTLVGAPWVLECYNILADPDSVPHVQPRPYVQPKPRRSRG